MAKNTRHKKELSKAEEDELEGAIRLANRNLNIQSLII
jgi:hypothetical protein